MIALVMLGMLVGSLCSLGGFLLAQRNVDRDVAAATAEGYNLAKEEFGSIFPLLDLMMGAEFHAVLEWRRWAHDGETVGEVQIDDWKSERKVVGPKRDRGSWGGPAPFSLGEWAMMARDRYDADHPLRLSKGA